MQKSKSFKIIIDTNLWISFIISNKLNILDELLFENKLRILFSIELIEEIKETIQKPKLKKYFKPNAFDEMFSKFEPFIELIEVKSKIQICRDPKDNFLLSLSKDGNADFLLTGDKDLLDINPFENTKIISISTFIEEIKNFR